MVSSPLVIIFFTIILTAASPILGKITVNNSAINEKLTLDFYKQKCPNVEQVVMDVMKRSTKKNPGWIPGIIRLHFHDCFITGCDASILITPERYNGFASELAHPLNGASIRGLDAIHEIKSELEKQCPGVVSCADILSYAARDAAVLAGHPHYSIPAGRRDGFSVDGNRAHDLPAGSSTVEHLAEMYAARGLTMEDLVVLEGAHSIGRATCQLSIANTDTLKGATGAEEVLDKKFAAAVLNRYCPKSGDLQELRVPLNPEKLDSDWGVSFYDNIIKGKGLIGADLAMAANGNTKEMVHQYARDSEIWKKKFSEAMIKLGKVNVISGEEGEIRKHCSVLNTVNI
ncbi:hypothetical protein RND81_01G025800 [Saponaria officinalis]|uniref:Peroxidase n=1 Tax=Saponaria officinalis TaxID=3572 RepID=A0AAW1NBZ9_SAPOF